MTYNEFYDLVFEFIVDGDCVFSDYNLTEEGEQYVVETACDVEKTLPKETGDWDKTPLCDEIIEYAWNSRDAEVLRRSK